MLSDSPLALAGVLAIITQIDGAVAARGQQGIVRRQNGAPQNLQVLLVAGHTHTHMVGQPHLHNSGIRQTCHFAKCITMLLATLDIVFCLCATSTYHCKSCMALLSAKMTI